MEDRTPKAPADAEVIFIHRRAGANCRGHHSPGATDCGWSDSEPAPPDEEPRFEPLRPRARRAPPPPEEAFGDGPWFEPLHPAPVPGAGGSGVPATPQVSVASAALRSRTGVRRAIIGSVAALLVPAAVAMSIGAWRSHGTPGEVRIVLGGAVDAALVARVQSRLKLLGYAPGGIDGRIGPQTIAAVRAFQREHRMVVDGVVDAALLSQLTEQGGGR